MIRLIDTDPCARAIRPMVVPIDARPLVFDFKRSRGAKLYDTASQSYKIDFASSFASLPLGYNHVELHDPAFEKELLEATRIRFANLDILCEPYARFLETFNRVVGMPGFCRYFFIDGGALGVENAMKAAFDWKVRRNMARGRGERGTEILHFKEAFHGRSGYTLSVTNTADPNKTAYFPKFPWPRVTNPKCLFPLEGANLEHTIAHEHASLKEIDHILAHKADDIAAILIEPIQGEGGDNHFRPEFLRELRQRCDEHDVLLIFDEVQCGMGITGTRWCAEALGVMPDLIAFAKKAQVGGFMAGERLFTEPYNVFVVPSRISSTWGGTLPDMVRCRKYLEIYEKENIFQNVHERGAEILRLLHEMEAAHGLITNVRGRGLMIAFDLVFPETRGAVLGQLENNGLLLLGCGTKSIRMRPHLNVTSEVIAEAFEILETTLLANAPSAPATV